MNLLFLALILVLGYVLFKVFTSDIEWQIKMFIAVMVLFGIIVSLSYN